MKTTITANMARCFGLTVGNPKHEKLGRLLANPESKCVERFIYSRGLCCIFVGGMWLESVGAAGEGARWLSYKAEEIPELPHLKKWAEAIA